MPQGGPAGLPLGPALGLGIPITALGAWPAVPRGAPAPPGPGRPPRPSPMPRLVRAEGGWCVRKAPSLRTCSTRRRCPWGMRYHCCALPLAMAAVPPLSGGPSGGAARVRGPPRREEANAAFTVGAQGITGKEVHKSLTRCRCRGQFRSIRQRRLPLVLGKRQAAFEELCCRDGIGIQLSLLPQLILHERAGDR